MKNKLPLKYRIIFIILILPMLIISLLSLLTPYNLISYPVIVYMASVSIFLGVGVDLYAMYKTHKNLNINR